MKVREKIRKELQKELRIERDMRTNNQQIQTPKSSKTSSVLNVGEGNIEIKHKTVDNSQQEDETANKNALKPKSNKRGGSLMNADNNSQQTEDDGKIFPRGTSVSLQPSAQLNLSADKLPPKNPISHRAWLNVAVSLMEDK